MSSAAVERDTSLSTEKRARLLAPLMRELREAIQLCESMDDPALNSSSAAAMLVTFRGISSIRPP